MRKLKARVGLLAIVALGFGLVSCSSDGGTTDNAAVTEETAAAPAMSTEPIKIGVVADLTGPFTLYGTSLARSAELAVDEINAAGGIMGRQVELIVEDIATDVAITTDKARKLVESDMVDVVIGPIGSDASDAVFKTVTQDGKTLMIYPETYEGGKCDALFFSTGAVPAQQIRPMLPILQKECGPKVLLFGADYVWPRRSFEVAKPIIKEIGGEVVGEVYLPLVADDFTEFVKAVRTAKPDYIFTLYPAIWGAALKALTDAGVMKGVGVGTTFLGDPDLAGIGAAAAGQYTALPFFTSAKGDGVAAFLSAYSAKFGADQIPSGGESMGAYNAINLYKLAVEAAGSTDDAAVAKAMVGLSFMSPTGKVTMEASHHLRQTIQLVRVSDKGVYEHVQSFTDQDPEEGCSL